MSGVGNPAARSAWLRVEPDRGPPRPACHRRRLGWPRRDVPLSWGEFIMPNFLVPT
jgi:hypothetical protein